MHRQYAASEIPFLRNYIGQSSGNSSCTRERSQPVAARFLIYVTGCLYSYWVSNSTTTSHNFKCCFAMKHCEVKLEKAQPPTSDGVHCTVTPAYTHAVTGAACSYMLLSKCHTSRRSFVQMFDGFAYGSDYV